MKSVQQGQSGQPTAQNQTREAKLAGMAKPSSSKLRDSMQHRGAEARLAAADQERPLDHTPFDQDRETAGKWPHGRTVRFIVIASALLWAVIVAVGWAVYSLI